MFDGPWESCLAVRGLNPSECASWVQAWGTIGAIGAAFVVLWFQSGNQRRAELKKVRDEDVRRLNILYGAVFHMRDKLTKISERDMGLYYADWATVDQASRLLQSVPLMDIPDWTVSLSMAHAADCYGALDQFTPYVGDRVPPMKWFTEGMALLLRAIESHSDAEAYITKALNMRTAAVPRISMKYEDGPSDGANAP